MFIYPFTSEVLVKIHSQSALTGKYRGTFPKMTLKRSSES